MTRFRIGSFRGVVTSLEARNIPPNSAQDSRDVTVEDASIKTRRGFGTVVDSVNGQTTNKMFAYAQGYSDQTFVDAYLAIDRVSGNNFLYEIDPDCLRRTEVTSSGTALSLTDSYWRSVPWENKAYIWNYASPGTSSDPGPLMEYTLGDYDSLRTIAPPDAPTAPLVVNYAKSSTGGTAYKILRYSGADPVTPGDANEVVYDGVIATSTGTTLTGESWEQEHTNNKGLATVQFQLNNISTGDQDLQNADVLVFTITIKSPTFFQIDPEKMQFYVGNSSAGSADTELAVTTFTEISSAGDVVRINCYAQFTNKTRSSWATSRYIKFAYSVIKTSATVGNNHVFISPVTIGGTTDWPDNPIVGYGFRDSTTDLKSGVGAEVELSNIKLRGDVYPPSKSASSSLYMGTHVLLTSTTSSQADKVRFYIAERVQSTSRERKWDKWQFISEQDDTDTSYSLAVNDKEYSDLTEDTASPLVYDNILCAGQYKGWMIWGYRGGAQNIRHSRVNEPLLQASDSDVIVYGAVDPNDPDPFRGATFSLTDTFTDSPRGFVGLGDVLLILGEYGIYAQVGDRPVSMSPPKVIKGAPGCFGYESFCGWKDSAGNPSCCYYSKDGGSIYMVTVSPAFQGDSGAIVIELTSHVRGLIQTFLFGGSPGPSFEAAHIYVDKEDALNLFYNGRRMVLRRQSLLDGVRDWELYSYEAGPQEGNWNKLAHSQLRGTKVLRLTGQIDELDFNTVDDNVTALPQWSDYDGSGFAPSTTDTTNENIGFDDDPRWGSGAPCTASATGGGISTGVTYYLRKVTFQVFELYNSEANAKNRSSTTGRQDITAPITANVRHQSTSSGGYQPFSTDTANERLTMKDGPGWIDGTPVEVSANGGGLLAASTYYARRQSFYVRYELYASEPEAINFASTAGRVNLTATISAIITPAGRDGGSPIPVSGLYWRSRKFTGPRRRIDSIYVDRESLTETATISVVSGRQSAISRTAGVGKKNVQFASSQVDEVHDFKVKITEGSGPVYGIEVSESRLSPRRHA